MHPVKRKLGRHRLLCSIGASATPPLTGFPTVDIQQRPLLLRCPVGSRRPQRRTPVASAGSIGSAALPPTLRLARAPSCTSRRGLASDTPYTQLRCLAHHSRGPSIPFRGGPGPTFIGHSPWLGRPGRPFPRHESDTEATPNGHEKGVQSARQTVSKAAAKTTVSMSILLQSWRSWQIRDPGRQAEPDAMLLCAESELYCSPLSAARCLAHRSAPAYTAGTSPAWRGERLALPA